jgi:hypothetical protein
VLISRPPGTSGISTASSKTYSSAHSVAPRLWPVSSLLAVAVFCVLSLSVFSVSPVSLFASIAAGVVIGWMRRAWSIHNKFTESFVSALFGAGWGKESAPRIVRDILARAFVGYSVGVAFASLGVFHALPAQGIYALVAGGPGGGGPGDLDLAAWLGLLLVLIAIAAILGVISMLMTEGALLVLSEAGKGAAKSIVKDASASTVDKDSELKLGTSATKGAVTGVLVALLLAMIHLR